MLDNISGAVGDEKIYLFLDNASYHRNEDVRVHMKKLNIEPVYNVSYRFEFNPIERLWAMYKQYFRKALLKKMLDYPEAKSSPLKDALFQTFNDKLNEVKLSIPKFVKKALRMLRAESNEIRKEKGEEELQDIV